MDLTNISDLRLALRLAGLAPNKTLGQHFLADRQAVDQILAAAELKPTDTVLEIGPGLGVMTADLCAQAGQVVAVETDAKLAEILNRQDLPHLTIVREDILRYNLAALGQYKVVANLPYYITSAILRLLFSGAHKPISTVILVQKEVAQRIAAGPGATSVLALSVQYWADPEIISIIPSSSFWPPPEVDSAILKLITRSQPRFPAEEAKLFRLIKSGFGERRKMLKNSLAGGLNLDANCAEKILTQAKIPSNARAQELDWGQWERLYTQAVKQNVL